MSSLLLYRSLVIYRNTNESSVMILSCALVRLCYTFESLNTENLRGPGGDARRVNGSMLIRERSLE